MEKIIVIGTGKESESFLYNHGDKYDVVLFADDNPRRNSFRGRSVVLFKSILYTLDGRYKVIIATSLEKYILISRDLQLQGLLEFKDFIYYKAINKKIAIFFGNCQCQSLRYYVENLKEFSDKYWVYPYPAIQDLDYWYMPNSILESCDLFLYQAVKEATNGLLKSSDYLLSLLKPEAIKIKMPNLFRCGMGWYLQSSHKSLHNMRETEHEFVINTDNHDKIIKELYDKGFDYKEITTKIKSEQIWDDSEIINAFNESMNKIEEMDKDCDIKIYDFIKANYRDKLIFTDPGHISNVIYREYLEQLMKLLNIDITENLENCLSLKEHGQNMPIYGCIRQCLGLTYIGDDQIIKKDSFKLSENSSGGVLL